MVGTSSSLITNSTVHRFSIEAAQHNLITQSTIGAAPWTPQMKEYFLPPVYVKSKPKRKTQGQTPVHQDASTYLHSPSTDGLYALRDSDVYASECKAEAKSAPMNSKWRCAQVQFRSSVHCF
ncbi:hypothetical protein E4U32_000343 [Claviceps aff. humidiphila group G2b]|nr:hypothetical protein E4U32_000343 [Claviceps aff. humidiphila group G2b]